MGSRKTRSHLLMMMTASCNPLEGTLGFSEPSGSLADCMSYVEGLHTRDVLDKSEDFERFMGRESLFRTPNGLYAFQGINGTFLTISGVKSTILSKVAKSPPMMPESTPQNPWYQLPFFTDCVYRNSVDVRVQPPSKVPNEVNPIFKLPSEILDMLISFDYNTAEVLDKGS
ncbi:MAG: hypothetical protein Q8P57_00965 [Candidatus Pacearchaeota archaeon]|nr:hypothetical protein [Candidatus Pacearchaeota archaeon]